MSQKEKITVQSGRDLLVEKNISDDTVEVIIRMEEKKGCLLHWGLRRNAHTPWQVPPEQTWPEGTRAYNHAALQTRFAIQDGHGLIVIKLSRSMDYSLLDFVLFFPEEGLWDNNRGRNYRILIPGLERPREASLGDPELDYLADEIIKNEMSGNSWTLMHRFNLCYELLDRVRNIEGMALLFVWLRFSFIRQLDWQRNFNTKPRELGHAMDRLTLKMAERYSNDPPEREMLRLVMSTLGRGGDAQRVRDEVLNIMHRHHIKEVSGHFMEEWHQKLHNNTTPDDVVICEAYLEFLRSNGNRDKFYIRLKEGGVTRERLESYERPIKSPPDFIPHLKEALVRDFEHFLGILRAVHTGTDLGTAIDAARRLLDPELHSTMDFIWSHRDDRKTPVSVLVRKITDGRTRLSKQLTGHSDKVRDLLFLDIALEDFLRITIEKNLGPDLGGNDLVELIGMILDNLYLSSVDQDISHCLQLWERLRKMPRFGKEWSLRAWAVLDLIGQVMGAFIDHYYRLLQPRAEFLGNAFHAEQWTIILFSEEVMRGRPAFALSMLLRYLAPVLRKSVRVGDWQVISRGHAVGKVEVIETLRSIQGKDFSLPAVIIADRVSGNEEIPKGVTAILTPTVIDILSHLAVRARNAGLLFATCYDDALLEKMKSLGGRIVEMVVDTAGGVVYAETTGEMTIPSSAPPLRKPVSLPTFTTYAVSLDEFDKTNVGGKSFNVKRMMGKLPDWINLPASAALPFGVFEKVLACEDNKGIAKICRELVSRVEEDKRGSGGALAELRRAILDLNAPAELVSSLRTVMEKAGLPWPSQWDDAWLCIKKVWASKWNERAYLGRIAHGMAHEDLVMAVLVQKVVEADYSFVIHTVNPLTGSKEEIYGEVVSGLGEALVGNYPGKALSFVCDKGKREPRLLSFPGKSAGLFGGGLIFRSDSNGEDLTDYAGAGIYDSFILPQPRKISLNYTDDPLFWNDDFRRDLLIHLSEIGVQIENILGGPQDIEGAYSDGRYYAVQSRAQVGIENA